MSENRDLQVGRSFLVDVDKSLREIDIPEGVDEQERAAKHLESLFKTLELARETLAKTPETDLDAIESRWEEVLLRARLHDKIHNFLDLPARVEPWPKFTAKKRAQQKAMSEEAFKVATSSPQMAHQLEAWWYLGFLYLEDNKTEEAIAAFQRVADADTPLGIDAAKKILEIQQRAKNSGGCFVATAAWGDEESLEVNVLREFRDQYLARSWWGRAAVAYYYRLSPPMAKYIARSSSRRRVTRSLLAPMVTLVDLWNRRAQDSRGGAHP